MVRKVAHASLRQLSVLLRVSCIGEIIAAGLGTGVKLQWTRNCEEINY